MLYKKELEQVPVQNYPEIIPIKDTKAAKYVATVQVLNLEKSGKLLVIDVFLRGNKELQLRFFSDGNSFLACKEWPAAKWLKSKPTRLLEGEYAYRCDIDAFESDIKKAHDVLKKRQVYCYRRELIDEMDSFVAGLSSQKNEEAAYRKQALMKAHFEMFPDYPPDLKDYCETDVFGFTYIFISKIQKESREAICGHCGHQFLMPRETKVGEGRSCPKCHMKGILRAGWRSGGPTNKAKLCIAYNVQNQLLLRWIKIERTFNDSKVNYSFEDYYRNLYLQTPKGQVIYAYKFQNASWGFGCGWDWYRQRNGMVNYDESYVYNRNLSAVFGTSYYHVDLQTGLKNAGQLSFRALLGNLKTIPAAEYLFKLGMTNLVTELGSLQRSNGKGFSEILGISKQYLPLYRKFNVTLVEHRIISKSMDWVKETSFLKLRALSPKDSDVKDIGELLKTMSFERFANYFYKQIQMGKSKALSHYLMLYKDYLSMSETLKVDLSRKSVRFPNNIKESHDLILFRFNRVKHKNEDKKFKRAVKKLYAGMPQFANSEFCIVYPALRSDLIKEGQSLNHCVGADRYYKDHIAGTQMIFFVRKITEPQKPFVTMEVDMQELRIRQLYGYGDKLKNSNVRAFANEFLVALKRKENKVQITVSA
ncbi:PcfJ domain-containing protein [Desulfitobacterium hafniense]|uniref:PcfJ domain-containing protein n=1 Tax=Desulfitobacterium hafniense TaxID=49338 RepID=UPI00035C3AD4|nr:PcfJ domain-containing protein [Desulfitobacterium hafniense]